AIIRIYFNVSNGQVNTRTVFAVSKMTPIYYNETSGQWVEIQNFIINEIEGYVEFEINHFSFYAIIGKENQETTTPTPPIPGFEVFFSLIGLVSIVLIYIRRKQPKNPL
ncbi:MAG: Heimdall-CTERM domain-containing surface protein, partial [Candidatus Helarchaeota archaeon]